MDTVRSVAIKLALIQEDSKIKVPDVAPLKAAAAEVAQTNVNGAKATAEALKSQNTEVEEFVALLEEAVAAEKAHKSLVEEERAAREQLNKTAYATAESFNKIGEGAFKLTRGMALLSGGAGADLAELMNKVARVQAGYDLFKGAKDIVTGVGKSYQIFAEGAKAAAVATGVLTTAQAASNTVAARGVVIQAALTAAMGPLGLTIAAVTAAVAIGAAVWSRYNAEAERATKKFAEAAAQEAGFVAGMGAGKVADLNSVVRNVGIDDTKAKLVAERDGLSTAQQAVAVNERLAALKDAQAKFALLEKLARSNDNEQRITRALQGQLDIEKAKLDIQKNQRAEVEQTLKAKMQELETQKGIVKAAEDALKKERDRLQDLDALVGKLNDVERAELKRLGDKVKGGGNLTPEEAERVEKLGGSVGGDFAKRFFAKKGQDAGGAQSILGAFLGPDDKPLRGEGSEEQKLAQDLEAAKAKAKALQEAIAVLRREDASLLDSLIKTIDQTRARQDELQRQLESTQANFAAQNAARGGVL